MKSLKIKVYISLLFLKSTSLRPNSSLTFDYQLFTSGLIDIFFGRMDVWTQKIIWTYTKPSTSTINPSYIIDYMCFIAFWTYGRSFSL